MNKHNLQSGASFQHGSQFSQHNQPQNAHKCHEADDGFQHLQAHVATSAFDSQNHVDAPKCHPNTRTAVLDEIMNWIILSVTRIQWILWLNGAAGAGKSAIGRSIVDLCIEKNIPIARFFFFRTDSTRNNVKPLVATLVHQLLHTIPDLRAIIIPRIEADSLIFTKSLKTQFEFLIFAPLRELQRNCKHLQKLVLLFDGLDECNDDDDQADLIRIIAEFVGSGAFPALAFFASRNEDQITTVFRSASLSNITRQVPLDNEYRADDDIRLFLDESFDEIKRTHRFARLLSDNWPEASHVQEIVEKSSGQFIYASVVIKFCSMLGHHPQKQLEIVRGLQPRGTLTPFAQLDALYHHIFSQVGDLETMSLVVAWTILTKEPEVDACAEFCGMQTSDVYVSLAPLQSVIDCTSDDSIKFLHASLPDFLLDKDRSQEYYINCTVWSTRLAVMAHKFVMSNGDRGYMPADMFLSEAECTPELQDSILAYNPEEIDYSQILGTNSEYFVQYLGVVKGLDFGDGPSGAVYKKQLNCFVRYCRKTYPAEFHDAFRGRGHAISDILHQIEIELGSITTETVGSEEPHQHRLDALAAADENLKRRPVRQENKVLDEVREEFANHSAKARELFRKAQRSDSDKSDAREAQINHAKRGTTSVEGAKFDWRRLFRW